MLDKNDQILSLLLDIGIVAIVKVSRNINSKIQVSKKCPQSNQNLKEMHTKYEYQPSKIWNLDECGAQTNKNRLQKIMARKDTKNTKSSA